MKLFWWNIVSFQKLMAQFFVSLLQNNFFGIDGTCADKRVDFGGSALRESIINQNQKWKSMF